MIELMELVDKQTKLLKKTIETLDAVSKKVEQLEKKSVLLKETSVLQTKTISYIGTKVFKMPTYLMWLIRILNRA